jgi:hypothetical protein
VHDGSEGGSSDEYSEEDVYTQVQMFSGFSFAAGTFSAAPTGKLI